ncbi:MAG: hypothetical protein JHD16_02980 [Solirubrobacteraceae bacterium]|nr:hypothetical protein [Solirubrobacteraceae bacterium]
MSAASGNGVPLVRSVRWSLVYAVLSRGAVLVSVPIVLQRLGAPTYAAWVISSALIYSQGLVDFGAGTVGRRFVAESASQDSRAGVVAVLRTMVAFYLVLSVVVGGALFVLAPTIAGWLADDSADQVTVLRYAAAAFCATNAVFVLAAVVEGSGRVDTSYRLQSVGAVLIVPLLLGSVELGAGVHAIGITWLVPPLLISVLLARAVWKLIVDLDPGASSDFSLRSLLGLAGGWQVSAWADFASFQLPRVIAGFALPVSELVTLDLALRIAQLVVFPLFAAYPVVLPLAVRTEHAHGRAALRGLVFELQRGVLVVALLAMAITVPVAGVLIETWTGGGAARVDAIVTFLIVFGVTSHASTGIVSATLVALGTVRTIVLYKTAQLALCLVLVVPGSALGVVPAAAALAIGLALPAAWFLWQGLREVGVAQPWLGEPVAGLRLLAVAAACAAAVTVVVGATDGSPPLLGLLSGIASGSVVAGLGLLWLDLTPHQVRSRIRAQLGPAAPVGPAAPTPPPVY